MNVCELQIHFDVGIGSRRDDLLCKIHFNKSCYLFRFDVSNTVNALEERAWVASLCVEYIYLVMEVLFLERDTRSHRTSMENNLVLLPDLINVFKVVFLHLLLRAELTVVLFDHTVLSVVVNNCYTFLSKELSYELAKTIRSNHSIHVSAIFSFCCLSAFLPEQLSNVWSVLSLVGMDRHSIVSTGFVGVQQHSWGGSTA